MHNLLKYIKNRNNILLCIILGVAFLVRVIGIGWYLPNTYVHDEIYTVAKALNLITPDGEQLLLSGHNDTARLVSWGLKTSKSYFNPYSFGYPPVSMYIQAVVYKLYFFGGHLLRCFRSINDMGVSGIFWIGRFITALFGIGTVLLTYLIGKKMYSVKIGLLSSLFLCFNFLHIYYSRFIKPDVPMTFFITLSFLFIYLIYREGKAKYYILASIFMGLAIATKYTGVILIIPIFLAHLFYGLEKKQKLFYIIFNKKVALFFFFLIGGFFLGCPHGLVKFSGLIRTIKSIYAAMNSPELNQVYSMNSYLYYITEGFKNGVGLSLGIFSIGGIIYSGYQHRKKDILLLSFPAFFFLFVGSFLHYANRYIIPMFPFLAILAAVFVVEMISKIKWSKKGKNFIIASLAIGIIFIPGMKVVNFLHIMTEKGTGVSAKEWVEENIPPGSKIAIERYGPPISDETYEVYFLMSAGLPRDWYEKRKIDYIIVNDFAYERYFKSGREIYH